MDRAENIRRIHEQALLPKQKKIYFIPKQSKKKLKQIKSDKENRTDFGLDQWFEYFMERSEPKCAECGMEAQWLKQPEYALIWRACQAHILPKKKNYGFPSLATNLDNHIILFPSWGGLLCGCHGFYDSNWYNATTMNIWKLVAQIFKDKLVKLIPQGEQKNIPEVLLNELTA